MLHKASSHCFFGHNWQISSALNLDWGIRYESMRVEGHNSPSVSNQDTTGGLDHDPLTLYDNAYGTTPNTYFFGKTVNTFSYSAGLNYKLSNNFSLYGRYSEGNKAPDLDMYFNASTDFLVKTLAPEAQKVRQFELGVKAKTKDLNLFVTPFYSVLSSVPNVQTFQNADQTFYSPPTVYNKYKTYGVELEADYSFAQHFNVRGVLTLQKSKATDYHTWLANDFGPDDDSLVSYSGNETDNIARSIINITPSYNLDKFYAQLTWAFMGKRQANVANAFLLPSFSQFNFSTGYDISKHFQMSLVINNIFNTYGVMSWSRPGSFLQALDRQGFTKEMYEEAVKNNTPYSTVSIPARAYFITATFKF
jgi:outer membrane receptor protein involved in Fe transport